jgi:hypothetical protein
MIDASGHPLRENFYKTFRASRAIREPVATERWTVLTPMAKSHQPLELLFPRPLDWAQLWHAITVASERDQLIDGQIAINRGEKRWSFTPKSAWNSGAHYIRVASSLEDVCGNNLSGAFDRPLRTFGDLANAAPSRSIAFHVS